MLMCLSKWSMVSNIFLGGGFKYFLFSSLFGQDSHFDYFFQLGWNHQLVFEYTSTTQMEEDFFATLTLRGFFNPVVQLPRCSKRTIYKEFLFQQVSWLWLLRHQIHQAKLVEPQICNEIIVKHFESVCILATWNSSSSWRSCWFYLKPCDSSRKGKYGILFTFATKPRVAGGCFHKSSNSWFTTQPTWQNLIRDVLHRVFFSTVASRPSKLRWLAGRSPF